MNLTDTFFGKIVPVKLDEPTQATLEILESRGKIGPFSVIVIPKIDSHGRFVLDFYEGSIDDKYGFSILTGNIDYPDVIVRFCNDCRIDANLSTFKITITFPGIIKGRLIVTQREFTVRDCPISFAHFSIADFPIFLGQGAQENTYISVSNNTYRSKMRALGYSEFSTEDGWEVTISECLDKGESGVTHIGSIRKTDESEFSIAQLKELIDGLIYFLSFITGVYRSPRIVIGYNSKIHSIPIPTWGRIGDFDQSKYRSDNWFYPQSREAIAALFPGFWRRFKEDPNKVRSVVESYAESSMITHLGLPKNALTHSQSALEELCHWILIRKRRKREPASEYIKEALKKIGVSYDLCEYPYLLSLWQQSKHKEPGDDDSGPTVITRLRNRSVHSRGYQVDISDYFHAWKLSQVYVELMLLWMFEYKQDYYDRASDKYGSVPWVHDK